MSYSSFPYTPFLIYSITSFLRPSRYVRNLCFPCACSSQSLNLPFYNLNASPTPMSFHYVTSPKHTSLYVTYLLCSCISLYMPFKYQYTSPEPSSLLSMSPYHTSITLLWLHNFWLFINIYNKSGIKSLSLFIIHLCTLVMSGQQWKKSFFYCKWYLKSW